MTLGSYANLLAVTLISILPPEPGVASCARTAEPTNTTTRVRASINLTRFISSPPSSLENRKLEIRNWKIETRNSKLAAMASGSATFPTASRRSRGDDSQLGTEFARQVSNFTSQISNISNFQFRVSIFELRVSSYRGHMLRAKVRSVRPSP